MLADISPARISALESALNPNRPPQDEGAVIGNYGAVINDMITLADQVSLGVSDAVPDQRRADAQRAVAGQGAGVGAARPDQLRHRRRGPGQPDLVLQPEPRYGRPDVAGLPRRPDHVQLFTTAYNQEFVDEAAFHASATPAESAFLSDACGPQAARFVGVSLADNISQNIMANNATFTVTATSGVGRVGQPAAVRRARARRPADASGARAARQPRPTMPRPRPSRLTTMAQVLPAWDSGPRRQARRDAGHRAVRRGQHRRPGHPAAAAPRSRPRSPTSSSPWPCCSSSCWPRSLVARSLVLPLRRLRAGALDIASVQLPERVRLLSENARCRPRPWRSRRST